MPASKSTIAPTINYLRIHTLVDAYRISNQWWEDRKKWVAMTTAIERDDGAVPCIRGEGRNSTEALIDILTILGHGKELYL